MTQPLSRYRVRARADIAAVLLSLPDGATRKDAERALKALGLLWHGTAGQGLSWPYKCYLRERSRALNLRWPAERVPCEAGRVRYFLGKVRRQGVPWLTVDCSWCDNGVDGGCLACVEYHARAGGAAADAEFRALREGVKGDKGAWGVLADWLAERYGIDAEVVA